jgi:hypothetical protein
MGAVDHPKDVMSVDRPLGHPRTMPIDGPDPIANQADLPTLVTGSAGMFPPAKAAHLGEATARDRVRGEPVVGP